MTGGSFLSRIVEKHLETWYDIFDFYFQNSFIFDFSQVSYIFDFFGSHIFDFFLHSIGYGTILGKGDGLRGLCAAILLMG